MNIVKKVQKLISIFYPQRKKFAAVGSNTIIEFPVYVSYPKSVVIESDVRVRQGSKILISDKDSLTVKRNTVVGMNCMIVTNKHVSTVGVPQFLLGTSGINDQHFDVIIGEDVWIGANVTMVGNASLGRGCICGACCTVTKPVPPYAVVSGTPARIVAVKFSIDQILEHEKILYSEEERYTREFLTELFDKYYQDKKVFGESKQFDDSDVELLRKSAEYQNYTDMDYFERIKKLHK